MTTIARATQALDAVRPGLPRAKRQVFLGQVRAESAFGDAFKTPDGSPSNNWGAIYAKGDRGTIPVADNNTTMQAAWNSTPEVGARQFTNLIAGSYPQAWAAADTGDAWQYARGLWRKGPNSSSPPYFMGFPPGHKWSLAPKGTKPGSALDYYYRVLAYARMVAGSAAEIARALGEPVAVRVNAPSPSGSVLKQFTPASSGGTVVHKMSGGGGLGALVLLAGGGYLVSRAMK